jgi:hypothetical protein
VFGIYYRFGVTAKLTFFRTVLLLCLFDTLALVYSAFLMVPLFDSRKLGSRVEQAPRTASLNISLLLNILHLGLQVLTIKLALDMVIFKWYR